MNKTTYWIGDYWATNSGVDYVRHNEKGGTYFVGHPTPAKPRRSEPVYMSGWTFRSLLRECKMLEVPRSVALARHNQGGYRVTPI